MSNIKVLYLFVTSICNAKCHFCFYGEELNKKEDLSFDELEQFSKNLGRINSLMISGGEPFTRKDLHKVVTLFHKNNKIKYVSIPTNGSLVDRSLKQIKEICSNKDLFVRIQISLDDFADVHDSIRKVPEGFKKAIDLISKIKILKKTYPNLSVSVSSVLSSFNKDTAVNFSNYVNDLNVDDHNVEIERPTLGTISEDDSELSKWSNNAWREQMTSIVNIFKSVVNLNIQRYSLNNHEKKYRLGIIGPLLREIMVKLQFKIKNNLILNGKKWPMNCVAGKKSLVIDHNGTFRACEMRSAIGNIKNYDLNFKNIYDSAEYKNELETIKKVQCWKNCTHGCNIGLSIQYNKFSLLIVFKEALKTVLSRVKFIFLKKYDGLS